MPDPVADMTLARIRRIAGERVTRINETTRDAIRGAIVEGVDLGEGAAQLGARISEAASLSPYRGELIARTETMHAWNASALGTYADEGVTLVEAEDGDEDDECRERQARDNGYGPGIYTLEEAMAEEDHPNGTLAWSPVISADEIAQLRQDVIEMGWGEEPSLDSAIEQSVTSFRDQHVNDVGEHAAIIDPSTGRIIAERAGERAEVNITGMPTKHNIVVHNHPGMGRDVCGLSDGDIVTAIRDNVAEMRAEMTWGSTSMRPIGTNRGVTGNLWSPNTAPGQTMDAAEKAWNSAVDDAFGRVVPGSDYNIADIVDYANRTVAERFGWEYRVTVR